MNEDYEGEFGGTVFAAGERQEELIVVERSGKYE